MKRETGLSPKGEGTRERVLAHARDVFIEQGYGGLILRRIAESLEMKLSNVQYYFNTKDDLVTAIFEHEERYDISMLRDALSGFESGEDVVRHIVRKLLNHWRGPSGAIFIAREFFAINNPAIKLTKKETDDAFFKEMEKLVSRLNPSLDKAEVRRRRRVIVSLLDGAALQADPGNVSQFVRSIEDAVISLATAASM